MTNIPSNIQSVILERYKSLESPDFSFVQKCFDSNPYKDLLEVISLSYSVSDNTDINDDVCFSLVLEKNKYKWLLQLSMVGRYSACYRLSEDDQVINVFSNVTGDLIENELALKALLSEYEVKVLTKDEMEMPINLNLINTDSESVSIYQALFCDTDIYPWEGL